MRDACRSGPASPAARPAASGSSSAWEIDLTGKKAGRGAYLHPQAACWETALKRNRLEAALKTKLTPDDRLRLHEFVAALSEAVTV
jgi:predicted RNA-binding protein YlxR (DUF448 family)